jgi:hypothetical protein
MCSASLRVARCRSSSPSAVVGRLVHYELRDRQTRSRRVQGEGSAGGMAVHRRLAPGLFDEGAEVFDLALEGVGCSVTAVAAAPAVVVEHGEMLCQLLGGRVGQSPVGELPAHYNDRLAVTQLIEGDRGAVVRRYSVHGISFRSRMQSRPPLIPCK